jgi:penicillin-binding protein 2
MELLVSTNRQSWLSWFLRGIIILGFLILVARLFELQVIKGKYFRLIAEENRIRRIPIKASRGKILARGGEVLVGSEEIKRKITFNKDGTVGKVANLEGAVPEDIITEWTRTYPLGEKFAHAGGYLGEVNESEVGKINPQCPEKGPRKIGDLVGRSGLEEEYECILSGLDGEELIEVDTQGRKVRTLGKREPTAGKDVKTSIDFGLQQKVAGLLGERKGAIVITDVTGAILAFYSSPSYDPNLFLKKPNSGEIEKILNDENLPLFNRAVGGQFHPGSVFKPVVAVAALQEGKVDKNFLFEDPGVITIETSYGKYSYSNWYFNQYGRTEGKIGIVRAIARSTDTFFYNLGELIGIDNLVKWAGIFGFEKETGIDIPGEIASLVPSPEWKERVKGEQWFLGNTYHMSIGQGDLAVTPIAMHRAISVIASAGNLCPPHIGQIEGVDYQCKSLGIKKENLELVKEGMVDACSPGGTGYTFFDFEPRVACKTGTAETNVDGKTHAWFIAFAPADFPEIVATVLVERGGEGSKVAGPIAREIFDYWFHP